MSKIFKQNEDYAQKPKRNNFDLSYSNNFTCGFGTIVPLLSKEVNAGESFKIDASIGLRALPLAFPIQTPVRVQVSYFYQRYRNLQTNWMDFYTQTKDIEIPYISIPAHRAKEISTGTLADYLGVPTTYADQNGVDYLSVGLFPSPFATGFASYNLENIAGKIEPDPNNSDIQIISQNQPGEISVQQTVTQFNHKPLVLEKPFDAGDPQWRELCPGYLYMYDSNIAPISMLCYHSGIIDFALDGALIFPSVQGITGTHSFTVILNQYTGERDYTPNSYSNHQPFYASSDVDYMNSRNIYHEVVSFSFDANNRYVGRVSQDFIDLANSLGKFYITVGDVTSDGNVITDDGSVNFGDEFIVSRHYTHAVDVSNFNNPFVIQQGETEPDIKLSAYAFRCYESIYNAYYRNSNGVDPFVLNGVEEYNRYCTNLGDGADSTTPLELKQRNYELDAFTSCYKSPQLGDAALVGVSATGKFKFEDEQGQTFTVTPVIGDDGNTLTGIDSYDEGTPIGALTRLRDLISYGISINDFRNVSAFQKFLENSLRRGLRYTEALKAHSGTNAKYHSVDLPEYLGGFSRNLDVRQISNNAQTAEMDLGDYRGQAGLFSGSNHSIRFYADEPGLVMCLLTIVPIPCYSQMLDTKFIKDSLLSWHFPEFNGIGLQPIDRRVVCPIQAKVEGRDYTETFGYQRPYWDLIASYDEVHGKFRTDLQGFLITRNFTQSPDLNSSFLHIEPSQMTNPFVDSDDDKHTFMGQITFDIKAKRPIPRIHVPHF